MPLTTLPGKPRRITQNARFTREPNGDLRPIDITFQEISQEYFQAWVEAQVTAAREGLRALQEGNGTITEKNPLCHHPRLGPVAISYDRLDHIIKRREQQIRREPENYKSIEEELDLIAESAVRGSLLIEPPTKSQGRTAPAPQLWSTHLDHQVTIALFWDAPGQTLGQSPVWILSGYRMGEPRRTLVQQLTNAPSAQVRFNTAVTR